MLLLFFPRVSPEMFFLGRPTSICQAALQQLRIDEEADYINMPRFALNGVALAHTCVNTAATNLSKGITTLDGQAASLHQCSFARIIFGRDTCTLLH